MEDWELDFEWLAVRHFVQEATKRDALPDLNGVLLMIGVQELGHWRVFTKEEKQDLKADIEAKANKLKEEAENMFNNVLKKREDNDNRQTNV